MAPKPLQQRANTKKGRYATQTNIDEGPKWGLYDRLVMRDRNEAFGDSISLGLRGACWILVCGMPFLFPESFCPICYQLVKTKFYTAVSVTYFIFTFYKTTGDTINFAVGGIKGTITAVFTIWCMMGFMPGGYQPDGNQMWFWYGGAVGAAYIFLMLFLNVDGNTRIFGCTTFVWYWMAFLNHNVETNFAENFTINVRGQAMSELMVAMSGCSIAVMAAFFPYPLFAQWKMQETGAALKEKLCETWVQFTTYFHGDEQDPLMQSLLSKKLANLKSDATSLAPFIDSSWYECCGFGPWNTRAKMMRQFDGYLSQCFDRLSTVLTCCADEDFSQDHKDMMSPSVVEGIEEVVQTVTALINKCHEQIEYAGYTENDKREAEELRNKVDGAVTKLSQAFVSTCQAKKFYRVSDTSSGENVVCSTLCAWATATQNFSKKLEEPIKFVASDWRSGEGPFGMFAPSVLFDDLHISFVMRGWISVMAAFCIGFHGVGAKTLPAYNPAVAGLCCVLLSAQIGGALQNNLKRLQGVILGVVLGQILYATLAWCSPFGYIAVGLTCFLWSWFSLYMYFYSEGYSTVGLLLGVFGNGALLKGCSDEQYNPTAAYYSLLNVVFGLAIMTTIDFILIPAQPSAMATEALRRSHEPLKEMVEQLFDDTLDKLPPRKGVVRGRIAKAEMLAVGARLEPRYWKAPWNDPLFQSCVSAFSTMRFCLATIDFALVENRKKSDVFVKALKLPEFQTLKKALLERMDFIIDETCKGLCNVDNVDVFDPDTKPDEKITSEEGKDECRGALDSLAEALTKLNDTFEKKDKPTNLEDDSIADMSILYACIHQVLEELNAVQTVLANQ